MKQNKHRTLAAIVTSLFPRYGLALVVDTLDGVDKSVAAMYKPVDGKFRLDVDGIEDTAGLKSALEKEREAVKVAKAEARRIAEQYKDIDPTKYKEMMSKLDGEDEQALMKAGRMDEVFAKRTEKLRGETQKEIAAAQAKEKAAEEKAAKFAQRVLDNHIRAAAAKAGVHASAVDDALLRARNIFALDEEGNAVQLGSDGKPIPGKDGKTPFAPAEWLEKMKEDAPHWFPAGSTGGGGRGDGGGAGGAKTMKRTVFDSLTPEEKHKAMTVDKVKLVD